MREDAERVQSELRGLKATLDTRHAELSEQIRSDEETLREIDATIEQIRRDVQALKSLLETLKRI